MSATVIESVLTGKLDPDVLLRWINDDSLEDVPEDCVLLCCSRSEFLAHFLYYLRSQTDSVLQTNSNALQMLHHSGTPEKLFSSRKHQRSISDPTLEADRSNEKLSVKEKHRSHESPSREKKRAGRKVKTKLFPEEKSKESLSSDDSRLSNTFDRIAISSTPMKNGLKLSEYPNISLTSPVTPHSKSYERCDTPRSGHRHSRSQEKSCLGDYLVSAQKSSKKKRSKNASDDSDIKTDLDLSNSDVFPEIGARKSNSLRSERRRIKPTNIDRSKKSLSLNSFNSECFQQPSPLALEENIAFKQQKLQPKELSNSFDVERNILKQERHKLMEKFNILNTESPKPSVIPQIKIARRESVEKNQNFVTAELTKVLFKEQIDILIDIYDALLKNNLILSLNTEIYFLISILLSKQHEDDYNTSEAKLNDSNNTKSYLLKVIHNSTYFAVKSLWHQKGVLEVILDKNSLKLLGENKNVRSFYPELAKFLLNSYGLKCEAEGNSEGNRNVSAVSSSNGVICFNQETDNAENFPSVVSFQNFKKQWDMFYEILRWHKESQPAPRAGLRARVKALLSAATTPHNHAHLATLVVTHMLAQCLPHSDEQESRMSKLQRRLTKPAAAQTTVSAFQPHEMFYKELLECADSDSFRAHARDALTAQLGALDAAVLAEDCTARTKSELSRELAVACSKLTALAKLAGLLAALPYTLAAPPRDTPLHNALRGRAYSQPTIDLIGILTEACQNGRLTITVPWIVQYLSMLDYTSIRTNYYQQLLKMLFQIYANRLKSNETSFKKNTLIFLKTVLGSLFSQPHFPQELFYEGNFSVASDKKLRLNDSVASENSQAVDDLDLIDETVLFELCPSLKEVNSLLTTSKVGQDQREMGSFRHITPVSLTLNTEERMRNKERELQGRLEEEFLKSQPTSTRRALDVVTDRSLAAAARQLAKDRASAKTSAYSAARECMKTATAGTDQATLLQSMAAAYTEHLFKLRQQALDAAVASSRSRAAAALSALLPQAPLAPLAAVASTNVKARLVKWLDTHWSTVLTDVEAEMKNLLALGEASCSKPNTPASGTMVEPTSAAAAIIDLKEQICLILEDVTTPSLTTILGQCLSAVNPRSPVCRAPTQKALAMLTLDLCVVQVSKRPQDVTADFLNQLHAIWDTCCPDRRRRSPDPEDLVTRRPDLSPVMRNFDDDERAPTPVSDDEGETRKIVIAQCQIQDIDQKSIVAQRKIQDIDQKVIVGQRHIQDIDQKSVVAQRQIQDIDQKCVIAQRQIQDIDQKSIVSQRQIQDIDHKSIVAQRQIQDTDQNNVVTRRHIQDIDQKSLIAQYQIQDKDQKVIVAQRQIQDKDQKVIVAQRQIQEKDQKIATQKSVSLISQTPPNPRNVSNLRITISANSLVSIRSPVTPNDVTVNDDSGVLLEYFDRVLCPRNIVLLSRGCDQKSTWDAMAKVLVFLLKNDYLSEDSLTEQCLAVYRQDWPQPTLEHLSRCMRAVSTAWRSSLGKFTLFLDFLAEYCGDMDLDPVGDVV